MRKSPEQGFTAGVKTLNDKDTLHIKHYIIRTHEVFVQAETLASVGCFRCLAGRRGHDSVLGWFLRGFLDGLKRLRLHDARRL